jgi:hypothetical protein
MRQILGCCAVLGSLAGCQPVVASYPKTPVPVLLSRVNRVHVKAPVETSNAGTEQVLTAKSEIYVATSSTSMQSGPVVITTTTTTSRYSGPSDLTTDALELVPNGADANKADIQVEGVDTGNFAVM